MEEAPFFRVLETSNGQVAAMCLKKGEKSGPGLNAHDSQDQFLYVISGAGLLKTDKSETPVAVGDLILINPGEPHQLVAGEEGVKTLDFYFPPAY